MTGRDAEREQLAAAMHADGHSLRFGPDGYVLDNLLPVVDRIANERAAAELEAAAAITALDWPSARVLIRHRAAALRASNGEGTT